MGLLKLQRIGNKEENSEKENIVNPASIANSCELGCLRRFGRRLEAYPCLLRVARLGAIHSRCCTAA